MYELAKTGETNDLVHLCTANFSILFEKLGIDVPIFHTLNTVLDNPRCGLFIDISRENRSVTYFFSLVSTSRTLRDLQDSAIFEASKKPLRRRPQRGIIGFACSNVGGISIDFWRISPDGNHHRLCPHPLNYEDNMEDIEALVAEVFGQE